MELRPCPGAPLCVSAQRVLETDSQHPERVEEIPVRSQLMPLESAGGLRCLRHSFSTDTCIHCVGTIERRLVQPGEEVARVMERASV